MPEIQNFGTHVTFGTNSCIVFMSKFHFWQFLLAYCQSKISKNTGNIQIIWMGTAYQDVLRFNISMGN